MEANKRPDETDQGVGLSPAEGEISANVLTTESIPVDRQDEAGASDVAQENTGSVAESQEGAIEANIAESADTYPPLAENVRNRLSNVCDVAFKNLDSVRQLYEGELIAKGWNDTLFIGLTQRLKNDVESLINEEFSDEELTQRLEVIFSIVEDIRSSNKEFFLQNKDCESQLEAIDNQISAVAKAVPIIVEARNLRRESQREKLAALG
jgi:hypothetical protein